MPRSVLALVPAYNPEPGALRRSIQSLVDQTVAIDILVIDDGSSAPIAPLLAGFPRTRVLRNEANGGITAALRLGVDEGLRSGHDYFCRLDVGDVAYADRVALQLDYMESHSEIAILGGRSRVADTEGRQLFIHGVPGREATATYLMANAPFKHSTFLMRSIAIRQVGNYDLAYDGAEDYELLLRLATRIACIPDVVIDYVDDPRGLSATKRSLQLKRRIKAQLTHRFPLKPAWYAGIVRSAVTMLLPATLMKNLSKLAWRNGSWSGA